MHRFFSLLAVNARILDALLLREMTSRFGHSRLGYLWALVQPMLGIGVLYIIFSTLRTGRTSLPLLMFLVTGWVTYGFYQGIYAKLASAAEQNTGLLMHRIVTRLDVLISRMTLEVLTAFSLLGIYAVIGYTVENTPLPHDPLLAVMSFLTAGAFGASIGFLMAGVRTYAKMLDMIVAPINRFGFFLSGVLFTAAQLPTWTHQYLQWNPMIHPIEGMRQAWFEVYNSPILDLSYTWKITLPIFAVALSLEQRSRKSIVFT